MFLGRASKRGMGAPGRAPSDQKRGSGRMGFWSAAWYAGSTLSIGLKRSGTPAVMALAAIAVLALLPATRADASFAPATNFGVGTNPGSVAIGNLNGDSFADLVVSNEGSDNVSVLLGNGSGSFGAAASFPVGSSPTSVAIGNLNGDSFADLAVANFLRQRFGVTRQWCRVVRPGHQLRDRHIPPGDRNRQPER